MRVITALDKCRSEEELRRGEFNYRSGSMFWRNPG